MLLNSRLHGDIVWTSPLILAMRLLSNLLGHHSKYSKIPGIHFKKSP